MTRRRCLAFGGFLLPVLAAVALSLGADATNAVGSERNAAFASDGARARGEISAADLLNAAWDASLFEDVADDEPVLNFQREVGAGVLTQERREPAGGLPSRVDNSVYRWFPPILKQAGGSCAQQAAVHNCYCYEYNLLRGTDAKLLENQFPAHWTWNCLNNADGKGSNGNAG